ncbi:hypothetical protein BRC94_11520 [Halobacteriales archaeon QS_5_70_17]|nr:MAG: hypothetical protein BRC94_11520 [Halobacteriales archaeon QS_5_70_17]
MNRRRAAGVALIVLALVGYFVGVVAPYPGRSFTLTGLMVGIALVATSGRSGDAPRSRRWSTTRKPPSAPRSGRTRTSGRPGTPRA